MQNGAHKTVSRESTRLINKEPSDLWKVLTPVGNSVSGPFTPEEFDAALKYLEPGKSPVLEFISAQVILHAESSLKSCLRGCLTSSMCQLKIPRIWRGALIVAVPKPEKLLETLRAIALYPHCGVTSSSSKDESKLLSNQSSKVP